MKRVSIPIVLLLLSLSGSYLHAQIVLMGDNPPYGNVNDGDFRVVWDYWRNASQSPFWSTIPVEGDAPMGLHYGTLFSSNDLGVAESKLLDTHPDYQEVKAGDVIHWGLGADLEYDCQGAISLSLVFGDQELLLLEKQSLKGGDLEVEHFSGSILLGEKEAANGLPFVRATFYSEQDVKVYLHYVNLSVNDPSLTGPNLKATASGKGIALSWSDTLAETGDRFKVYRVSGNNKPWLLLGESRERHFHDSEAISGIPYTYLVTRIGERESGPSNQVQISFKDQEAPLPPSGIASEIFDTEVKLSWAKNPEKDLASYSVHRDEGKGFREIASSITRTWFEDIHAPKGGELRYAIYAHDHSGNRSEASEELRATLPAITGASFSDLILPMPIHRALDSTLWGAPGVLPRDPDNGIEDPAWSYWGGRPVEDGDGLYHMLVTRWPEGALKGHWEWPMSTVAHVVSEKPTGPYQVVKDTAYGFKGGLGHNPDIILLNDGTYALYSLIDWEPTLFTSASMNGPWRRLGVMEIDMSTADPDDQRHYQYSRNLSGVQTDDGRIIIVSKFGAMMVSDSGLLGPYRIVTPTINKNLSIPERYRKSNYEDPVMWKDEVQYHMIINAFIDYRAIYLRSPDGIHWHCEPGLAYTPHFTSYEDGTQTHWYKLERPHVLTDQYGRATHLSLAVIDLPKKLDYGSDEHNSKNLILPLVVHRRLEMIRPGRILIRSEEGFDAHRDLNLESLRFGAPSEVNFGRGASAIKSKRKGKDLLLVFDPEASRLSEGDWTRKLVGHTYAGELVVGYCRLP